MSPVARPAEPRIAEYAAGVLHRIPWPTAVITIDGRPVQVETVITEVLRAADSIGLLTDSPVPPDPSAVRVDAAVRLLAGYHALYSLDPYKVLDSLPHAYTQARRAAVGHRELDLIDSAHDLLNRYIERRP